MGTTEDALAAALSWPSTFEEYRPPSSRTLQGLTPQVGGGPDSQVLLAGWGTGIRVSTWAPKQWQHHGAEAGEMRRAEDPWQAAGHAGRCSDGGQGLLL